MFSYKVKYLTDIELDEFEVFVKNGKLYNQEGELIKTTGSTAIFVMDNNGGIFIKFHTDGTIEIDGLNYRENKR